MRKQRIVNIMGDYHYYLLLFIRNAYSVIIQYIIHNKNIYELLKSIFRHTDMAWKNKHAFV